MASIRLVACTLVTRARPCAGCRRRARGSGAERGFEAGDEDDVAQAVALGFERLGRHVGVAELFEQLDGGVFGLARPRSMRRPVASCGALVGGDAEFAGEEDGHEGGLQHVEVLQRLAASLDDSRV